MTELRLHPVPILKYFFRSLDPVLLLILMILLSGSYLLVFSASPERTGAHLTNICIAVGVLLIAAQVPLSLWMRLAVPIFLVALGLLLGVKFFGVISKGAQRWLDIGITRIQPSELMKIAMPLAIAWYFQQRERNIGPQDFIIALLIVWVPVKLILGQPDLGTALLVAAAGLYVIYFAGFPWWLLVPAAGLCVLFVLSVIAGGDTLCQSDVQWYGLHNYQKERVCTLIDPTRDPLGKGFHIIQSSIAIGSGGLEGKGWMKGSQTHLAFLPERHTDFIFAVLAEEFGLIGCLVLIALYLLLLIRGLQIAARAPTLAGRVTAGALTMSFFTYAFVNMGMVSGILPVVGVPLPFISYGGTALVTLCLGVGLLMSIDHSRKKVLHASRVQLND